MGSSVEMLGYSLPFVYAVYVGIPTEVVLGSYSQVFSKANFFKGVSMYEYVTDTGFRSILIWRT